MNVGNSLKRWTVNGENAPKKPKTVPFALKMMAIVLWDSQGITMIDYLEKSKTIRGYHYATLLEHLIEELK